MAKKTIEEQFFDTFGMEQLCSSKYYDFNDQRCQECCANFIVGFECSKDKYLPKISDRVLLELMCLLPRIEYAVCAYNAHTVEGLKEQVLKNCIKYGTMIDCCNKETDIRINDEFKAKIQDLFKEWY